MVSVFVNLSMTQIINQSFFKCNFFFILFPPFLFSLRLKMAEFKYFRKFWFIYSIVNAILIEDIFVGRKILKSREILIFVKLLLDQDVLFWKTSLLKKFHLNTDLEFILFCKFKNQKSIGKQENMGIHVEKIT